VTTQPQSIPNFTNSDLLLQAHLKYKGATSKPFYNRNPLRWLFNKPKYYIVVHSFDWKA